MKLYGAIASAYTARVILVARCKGIELPTQLPKGEGIAALKTPEYLKLSPFGKIPALETARGCVVESAAICEYLDETGPGARLMPADPFERARTRMQIQVLDNYVLPHWRVLMPNMNPARRDEPAVAGALAAMTAALSQYDALLPSGPYMNGAALSLADCMAFPLVAHLENAAREFFGVSDLLRDTPGIRAWFEHMGQHPIAAPLVKEQLGAFMAFARAVFFA